MEIIERMIRGYKYLVNNVQSEESNTVKLVRTGNLAKARSKVVDELEEALMAFNGRHSHKPEKTIKAEELLLEKGLPGLYKDVLLELYQVSYWCLTYLLAGKKRFRGRQIQGALKSGSHYTKNINKLAEKIKKKISIKNVYTLIGCLSARLNIPLEIFAELDLKEMRGKTYFKDFFDGL